MSPSRALGFALRRARKAVPVARLVVVGQVAMLAGRHIGKLDRPQRARLLALLRQGRGRPSRLGEREREELLALLARMEPRAFVGAALQRLSPVPVPRRLVEGGMSTLGRALRGSRRTLPPGPS